MKLKCLIVDDESVARQGIAADLEEIAFVEVVALAGDAFEAIAVLARESIDVLFLDIQLPGLNGLEFLKRVFVRPMVIFTTAYPQYALDGYEHGVLDYLLKPVSPARLQQACRKALEWRQFYFRVGEDAGYFYIKSDGITERIAYLDVVYIEGANNYVYVHTINKKLMAYLTLKGIERQLPADRFIRVHKSFIIARDRIDRIEGGRLVVGGRSIPLSRRFRQEFRDGVLGSRQWTR